MVRWSIIVLVGCYSPSDRACHTRCNPATPSACPDGLVCGANGLCKQNGAGDCPFTDDAQTFPDAPVDAPSTSQTCYGRGWLRVCADSTDIDLAVASRLELDSSQASTCSQIQPQSNGPPICVVMRRRISVGPNGLLVLSGDKPIALVAQTGMMIEGFVDASSARPARRGPGGMLGLPYCSIAGVGEKALGGGGGAGGGAGGFSTGGGSGGSANGSVGGAGASSVVHKRVRGGCDGSEGGRNAAGTGGGPGGAGGGAVYLIAGGGLVISGKINASGMGGGFGDNAGGGGGGGSGGFIGLDAETFAIDAAARIFAVGGGGASGACVGLNGAVGKEAQPDTDPGPATSPTVGAGSGGGGSSAMAGGDGSDATLANCGGGGGGGGAGVVGVTSAFSSPVGTVRPATTAMAYPPP